MKKYSLALLVLTSVLATGARAAHSDASSSPVNLPTYVVEAERGSSAESHVNRSLNALRALAKTPVVVSIELPALKAPMTSDAKAMPATRLAKF